MLPCYCVNILQSYVSGRQFHWNSKYSKYKNIFKFWRSVGVFISCNSRIKQGTLNAILNESEKSVRSAIAQIMGVLVKHEFAKKDAWTNEVLQLIFEYTRSDDAQRSEVSFTENFPFFKKITKIKMSPPSFPAWFFNIRSSHRHFTRPISTSHGTYL